ncbi:oligosaccharide flippase family protein [Neptunicella marina]|uniref:Oligosaccharide flippase family protein n=1 Tax=Neptunicella marina TaxID=2125989 RepID=A0A8J6M0R8_9ALTE|nr:oligosaccharide flippase family protein [Neptunicella marina]MBC3767645.1 oligosaccharide flippase family protein [Neptunicella marina]
MSKQANQNMAFKSGNQKLANLLWIFSGNYGNVLFSVFSFFTYAYFLTPEQFGVGIFCIAIVESVGVMYGGAVEDPLVRRPEIKPSEISTTFWMGALISIISAFIALAVAWQLDYPFVLLLGYCFSKLTLSMACRPMVAICRKKRQFKLLSLRTLVARFLGTVAGIVVAFQGGGEWAIVSQAVFIEVFSLLFLLNLARQYLGAPMDMRAFVELLKEGLPIGLKATFWSLLTRGTIIVLGLVSNPTVLGYFGFANRLVRLPLTASTNSLNSYALPVIANKINHQHDVADFFNRITLATTAVFTPIFLLGCALAPAFIPLIFGNKWQQSVELFQYLSLIFGLKFCVLYNSRVLTAYGRAKLGLGREFINLCLFFIVLVALAPIYGGMAAVIALAIHALLDLAIKHASLAKLVRLNYAELVAGLCRILLCCVLMMLVADQIWKWASQTLQLSPVSALALALMAASFTYLFSLWLIFPRSLRQIKELLSK